MSRVDRHFARLAEAEEGFTLVAEASSLVHVILLTVRQGLGKGHKF